MPLWLKQKLHLPKTIDNGLGRSYDGPILFTEHHESHAASAFFPSPFEKAAILTVDGVGEWATMTWGVGEGNRITIKQELRFPHSLGLLYSAFTYFTGFRVNSAEYKVMGLAPYGEPKYVDVIYDRILDLKKDGSFRMNMDYFNYCQGLTMTNGRFARLFGGPPRKPHEELTQREMDLAASIQKVTEDVMLRMACHVHDVTGLDYLCLAGGCALNCVANGRILREGPYRDIWIQPAAGDAGGALGAALFAWYQYLGNERIPEPADSQKGSLLGPAFSDDEIEQYLDSQGARFTRYSREELLGRVSDLLTSGNAVGWFQGRMEFGPRALGSRSILGDARDVEMQRRLNLKIKFRESFRPFAPSVLVEHNSEYFELDRESPYMLLVAPVKKERTRQLSREELRLTGLDKLKPVRSDIPAVTHVDYSARIQTVDSRRSPLYHSLIQRFHEKTGCAAIVNTSFNIRGEPIVCTPEDAYRCFMFTDMDALAMGSFLLLKKDQPELEGAEKFRKQFKPD